MSIPIVDIYDTLYQMGFKGDNTGFFYLAYAAYLCLSSPNPEMMLNEQLYAMVGERYRTRAKQVRRTIFRTIACVWNTSPQQMMNMTKISLVRQPGGIETIRLLVYCVLLNHKEYLKIILL